MVARPWSHIQSLSPLCIPAKPSQGVRVLAGLSQDEMLSCPRAHSSFSWVSPIVTRSRKLLVIPQSPGLWSPQLQDSRLRRLLVPSSRT